MGGTKKTKSKGKAKQRNTSGNMSSDDDERSTRRTSRPSSGDAEPDFSGVSILNSPVLAIQTLIRVIAGALASCFDFTVKHKEPIIAALFAIVVAVLVPLPQQLDSQRDGVYDFLFFALYWMGLGIASSIGLGTGLHTFILYLGPHIAQVVMAANECNRVPDMVPSRWQFDHFAACPSVPDDQVTISFWTIYQAVFFEAFLWGAGTAIGELPPYFVARAASAAGGIDEELEDILDDEHSNMQARTDEDWMSRQKKRLAIFLKSHAFVTVLLMASIPNPLFDLAGLMCGHFQIPFATFFVPTLIGKAVNKVSIQVVFIIVAFSKHMMRGILSWISTVAPSIESQLSGAIEKQKTTLFKTQDELDAQDTPFIKTVWEWFITAMILYFILGFLNSLVRNQLEQDSKEGKAPNRHKKTNKDKV